MTQSIGILGAGQMGSGIAQVCAQAQFVVQVIDASQEALSKGKLTVEKSLLKLYEKGKLTQSVEEVLGRLTFGSSLENLSPCSVIIEAVPENFQSKKDLWQKVIPLVSNDAILASNTSSLSITKLGGELGVGDRMIGMHFMNPVPLMPLVEIIPGLKTSPHILEKIQELSMILGKTPVISKDFPGFIINRILMPMINEAFYVLQEGIATSEDIDQGMVLGTNQPMGPLKLADFIGLDTCLNIMKVLHTELGDSKYRPCPLLVKYVESGNVGRKSGSGVYDYP